MTTTLTRVAYTLTGNTVSIAFPAKNGKQELRMLPRTDELIAALIYANETGDTRDLEILASPVQYLTLATAGTNVVVNERGVFYRGRPVAKCLVDKLTEITRIGLDIEPWKAFIERIYANPSIQSQDELALFLEKANLPITEDGCFLAYKLVRMDYTDTHTGKFNNSIGQLLTMPRSDVDPNRHNTCSRGFHFCSREYLPHFGSWNGDNAGRVVVVKVDPSDVVSIPSDYSNSKGRTWRYEVVGELSKSELGEIENLEGVVARPEHRGQHVFEKPEVDEETETDNPDEVTSVAFNEPGVERVGVWKQAKAKATAAVAKVDKRWLQRRLARIERGELSWRALDKELGHPESGGKYAKRLMKDRGLL